MCDTFSKLLLQHFTSIRSNNVRPCLDAQVGFRKSPFQGAPWMSCCCRTPASLECSHECYLCSASWQAEGWMGRQCQACCLPAASLSCPASHQRPGDQEARAFLALFQYSPGSAVLSPVREENQHSSCRNTCTQFSYNKKLQFRQEGLQGLLCALLIQFYLKPHLFFLL